MSLSCPEAIQYRRCMMIKQAGAERLLPIFDLFQQFSQFLLGLFVFFNLWRLA